MRPAAAMQGHKLHCGGDGVAVVITVDFAEIKYFFTIDRETASGRPFVLRVIGGGYEHHRI